MRGMCGTTKDGLNFQQIDGMIGHARHEGARLLRFGCWEMIITITLGLSIENTNAR